jgi:hypothetical protein
MQKGTSLSQLPVDVAIERGLNQQSSQCSTIWPIFRALETASFGRRCRKPHGGTPPSLEKLDASKFRRPVVQDFSLCLRECHRKKESLSNRRSNPPFTSDDGSDSRAKSIQCANRLERERAAEWPQCHHVPSRAVGLIADKLRRPEETNDLQYCELFGLGLHELRGVSPINPIRG